MHRRPDLYGMDAEIFRPERWEEDLPLNHNPTNAKWGYLPFNGGPRICLGSKKRPPTRLIGTMLTISVDFAETETAYTIVRLIQRFPKMRLPSSEIIELTGVEKQTMTLVMFIAEGCKIQIDA